jgi:hypothetical protein
MLSSKKFGIKVRCPSQKLLNAISSGKASGTRLFILREKGQVYSPYA